jgi:hypothetical protein
MLLSNRVDAPPPNTPAHAHAHPHPRTTHARTRTGTHIHTCTHTLSHTHSHTHTDTHTHTRPRTSVMSTTVDRCRMVSKASRREPSIMVKQRGPRHKTYEDTFLYTLGSLSFGVYMRTILRTFIPCQANKLIVFPSVTLLSCVRLLVLLHTS